MYYDTAPSARFNKPAHEAVVDLINQANSTFFKYDELDLSEPRVLVVVEDPESTVTPSNTEIDVSFVTSPDRKVTLQYRRLDLMKFVGDDRLLIVTTYENSINDALAFLSTKYKTLFPEDECVLYVSPLNEDGSWTVTVTPLPNHFVWTGEVEILAVPNDWVRFQITETELDGLSYPDQGTSGGEEE